MKNSFIHKLIDVIINDKEGVNISNGNELKQRSNRVDNIEFIFISNLIF